MKRDKNICKRIMLQFEQTSVFSTRDYVEACHVGLLKDRNYVEADIKYDENGRVASAIIHRITALGYDELDGINPNAMQGTSESESIQYRNSLVKERHTAQKTFEKIQYLLSSGGIVLIVQLLNGGAISSYPISIIMFLSGILWGLNLVLLLILHGTSIGTYDYQIQGIDNGCPRLAHIKNLWSKVVVALYWIIPISFVIGLVLFIVGIYHSLNV